MDATKTAQPDRYLVTEVDLAITEDGHWSWVAEECGGCGGEHHYPAGGTSHDPRRELGYRVAPCPKPDAGTPLAKAAETLNLSLVILVLVDASPEHTMELMESEGLLDSGRQEDDVLVGVLLRGEVTV